MNAMIEMPIQVLDIVIYIFVFVCDETCDNVAVVRRTLATSRHGSISPGCHHHHNLGRHQLWCGGRRPQLQRGVTRYRHWPQSWGPPSSPPWPWPWWPSALSSWR